MTGNLGDFLQSTELFSSLDAAVIAEFVPDLRVVDLADGEALVTQGDLDQNLYVLVSGHLRAIGRNHRYEERLLLEAGPGESVGEMSVLCDDIASATILADGASKVVAIPRTAFDRFFANHPHAALLFMQKLSQHVQRYRLAIALHLSNVFDAFDQDSLRDLEAQLELFTLYGGEVLFRQGDPGDSMCIVICGRLQVRVRSADGQETTVAKLGSGEVVGEMGVVTGEARTGTVEAIRDTQLARLTRAGFDRFMSKHPQSALQSIARKLAERLKETTAAHARQLQSLSSIAVVPTHSGVPVTEFCKALETALSRFGQAAHLNSASVDRHLGREGIAQTHERGGGNLRLVEWLSNQEITNDYVLYEADAFLSPWTDRCVRQSDIILIVGEGQADPAPGEIETELLAYLGGRERRSQWLVLLHGESEPSGTKGWLDARKVDRHFHVRLGRNDGLERVARFLTGRAVGLALGGGFARGLAHVGVFDAFADLGIPIDAVGGASMGAMIGALFAQGWESGKIVRDTCDGCAHSFDDLTFPFIAFKTGKKFSNLVRKFFGDVQIEDLWIPFFCISANLNRSELKVHAQGSLAKAVLAATRAPGVFPPMVYEGELHVDGGVINNVPVDIMKTFCNQGMTMGVDVSPPHELNQVRDYGDDVSGWGAFWKRLNPFSKHHIYTPSILLVMIRTLEFSGVSYKALRLQYADVYMYPELLKFKRTDFHLADGIVNAGYDCARSNLLEWLGKPDVAERRPDLLVTTPVQASGAASASQGS